MKPILVSPHNPVTGPRHLGHLFGSMLDLVKLQDEYKCIIVLDDLLAYYMYPTHRDKILERTLFVVRDFLNSGIDTNLTDIVLTSKVNGYLELMMKLGTVVDLKLCNHLHENSFSGSLKYYQRKEIGLNIYPSVTEFVFPQLGAPAITLALQAKAFQGGEEISGYMYIMEEIIDSYNQNFGNTFDLPKYIPSSMPFVKGLDGKYMIQANSLILAATEDQIKSNLKNIESPEVLVEWFKLLGKSYRKEISTSGNLSNKDSRKIADFLIEYLAPYRKSKWTNGQLMEILNESAMTANKIIAEVIEETNTDFCMLNF